uniref:PB1 domain-containing protein n=1 Tax=Syphacia muris TaxID=451379 RepID=A0A0N5A9F7_9BILA
MAVTKVHFKFIGDSFNCRFSLPNHDLLTSLKRKLVSLGFLEGTENLYWVDVDNDLVLLDGEASLQNAVAVNAGRNVCVVSSAEGLSSSTFGLGDKSRKSRQNHVAGRRHRHPRHRSTSTISISSDSSSSSTSSSSSSSSTSSSSSALSMDKNWRKKMCKKWVKKCHGKRFGKMYKHLAFKAMKPHYRHMLQKRHRSHSCPPMGRSDNSLCPRDGADFPFCGPYYWWKGFQRSLDHRNPKPSCHGRFNFLPPPPFMCPPGFGHPHNHRGDSYFMRNWGGLRFGDELENFGRPHNFPWQLPSPSPCPPTDFQPPAMPHFPPPFAPSDFHFGHHSSHHKH